MGMPSIPELLIILAIVVLLFGAKKIPDLAKGMGKGIKDFKKAIKDDDEDKDKVADAKDSVKEIKEDAKVTNTEKTETAKKA